MGCVLSGSFLPALPQPIVRGPTVKRSRGVYQNPLPLLIVKKESSEETVCVHFPSCCINCVVCDVTKHGDPYEGVLAWACRRRQSFYCPWRVVDAQEQNLKSSDVVNENGLVEVRSGGRIMTRMKRVFHRHVRAGNHPARWKDSWSLNQDGICTEDLEEHIHSVPVSTIRSISYSWPRLFFGDLVSWQKRKGTDMSASGGIKETDK